MKQIKSKLHCFTVGFFSIHKEVNIQVWKLNLYEKVSLTHKNVFICRLQLN